MTSEGLVPELLVADFGRSFDFYTKELGFAALYQRPKESFAYLVRETSRIMIEGMDASSVWISGEMSYPFGRGINFQISVSDVQPLHDSLQKSGYTFFLPLEDKWYRKTDHYVCKRQFIIQDPDGYLLRFAQLMGTKTIEESERAGDAK